MALLLNRVRVATPTTGTGPITLGAAADGYQGFGAAGAVNGSRYSYTIEDGTAFEIGEGIYAVSGPSLSRNLIASSTGALLNLSGSASVFVSPLVSDLRAYAPIGRVFAAGGSATVVGVGSVAYSGSGSAGPTATDQQYANNWATAATANSAASLGLGFAGEPALIIPSSGNNKLTLRGAKVIFACPDSDYGSGSAGSRLVAGLSEYGAGADAPSSGPNGDGSNRGAWYRRDTSVGDVNWQLVIRGTTTASAAVVIDTGEPFSPGSDPLRGWFIIEGPNLLRWILERPAAGTYRSGFITANLPTEVPLASISAGVRTLSAVARTIRVSSASLLERAA